MSTRNPYCLSVAGSDINASITIETRFPANGVRGTEGTILHNLKGRYTEEDYSICLNSAHHPSAHRKRVQSGFFSHSSLQKLPRLNPATTDIHLHAAISCRLLMDHAHVWRIDCQVELIG